MDKPGKDIMQDLQKHLGWRYMEEWMKERIEEAKNILLSVSNIEDMLKQQERVRVYKDILCKVKQLSKEDQ